MSSNPRAILVWRVSRAIVLLDEPLTQRELSEELGISYHCAYLYIIALRDVGFEIRSRKRKTRGRGANPTEFWIEYLPVIFKEAIRLITELKGGGA